MPETGIIRLCGVWLQEKNGEKYMSGTLTGSSKLLIFKNKNKKGASDPDWVVCLATKEQKPSQPQPKQDDDYL